MNDAKQPQVTHAEAREAVKAFIDEHFHNKTERSVQTCIPARRDDDDILLMRYIDQQESPTRSLAGEAAQPDWIRKAAEAIEGNFRLNYRCGEDVIWSIEKSIRGFYELAVSTPPVASSPEEEITKAIQRVYANYGGNLAAFFKDVRAAALSPAQAVPPDGYPCRNPVPDPSQPMRCRRCMAEISDHRQAVAEPAAQAVAGEPSVEQLKDRLGELYWWARTCHMHPEAIAMKHAAETLGIDPLAAPEKGRVRE